MNKRNWEKKLIIENIDSINFNKYEKKFMIMTLFNAIYNKKINLVILF